MKRLTYIINLLTKLKSKMEKTYSDAEYWKSRWIINDIGYISKFF